MKHLLATIILGLLLSSGLMAQNILFDYADGSSASYEIDDVRKITFEDTLMNLHLVDGSIYTWGINSINHFKYDEITSLNEAIENVNSFDVNVFPNPTEDILHVMYNLSDVDEITITLYDIKGKVIKEQRMGKQAKGQHQEAFSVADLPQGNYLCRVSGIQESITKKVIKK
ncbi:MAG: T9SS type A sorting domain-containing protein [Chitinophagales bacterium]